MARSKPKTTTTTVRLTEDQKNALGQMSERLMRDPSDLIREAVNALISHYHAHGQRLVSPINFDEAFALINKARAAELETRAKERGAPALNEPSENYKAKPKQA